MTYYLIGSVSPRSQDQSEFNCEMDETPREHAEYCSSNGDCLPSYEAAAEQQDPTGRFIGSASATVVTALVRAPPPQYYTVVPPPPAAADHDDTTASSSPVQAAPPPQYGGRYTTREEFEADKQQQLIKKGEQYFIISLILTVMCGLLCPLLMVCSVTALVKSAMVRRSSQSYT